MDSQIKKSQHRVSLFFPLLLITVGIVLLWQNLGGQRSGVWDIFLRLWPLLLIFGGIDGLIFQQGTAVNTFWITFGLALLLSNFNRISWNTWEILLSLWPVLLVAVGVDLVFSKKSIWNRLAAALVVLFVMGGIVVLFDDGPRPITSQNELIVQERDGATQAEIVLRPNLGFLKIYAQGNQELLVEGQIQLWDGEKTTRSYEKDDNSGIFTLASAGFPFIYEPGIENRANWEIGISSRLPITLQISQAVGEISMDLTELQIDRLETNLALGRTSIILPFGGNFDANLGLPIGGILIEVPENIALVVVGRPAIGSVSIPPGYLRDGNRTVSPLYEGSSMRITLTIDMAIGQIVIRER